MEEATGLQALEDQSIVALLLELEDSLECKNLSLRVLSRKYGMSSARLGRAFRSTVGCSFRNYVRYLRMRQVQGPLCNPRLSLSEIAYGVGYKELSSFDRDFRATFHTTPSLYRVAMIVGPARHSPEERVVASLLNLLHRACGLKVARRSPSRDLILENL
jgi:AraC-like DNA-binding protein